MARPRKNARTITVDMEGIQSGGVSVPEGTYTAKIEEVEHTESKSSGEPMLVLSWRITSKKKKGTVLRDHISLQPQALWRLKMLLEGLDIEVPDSSMDIDLDELEGQEVDVQVANEKYEGKERSRIIAYGEQASKEDDEDDEDPDEKPSRRSSGKSSTSSDRKPSSKSDEDEDDDDEEEDERADNRSQHRSGVKKLKKGAEVRFKDEKGKRVNGTVTKIDGDLVTVEDEASDEWEVETSEVTVIG